MKKLLFVCISLFLLVSCSDERKQLTVKVGNSTALLRVEELVEIPLQVILDEIQPSKISGFVIMGKRGHSIPYQITHDEKVVFPVSVAPYGEAVYTIMEGDPRKVDKQVGGTCIGEHPQHLVWENESMAYVVEQHADSIFPGYNLWLKSRKKFFVTADSSSRSLTDAFSSEKVVVNNDTLTTVFSDASHLGCGGMAVVVGDTALLYPSGWKYYEILDDGPLRFTVQVLGHRISLGQGRWAEELRTITLDAGSSLNKITVCYRSPNKELNLFMGLPLRASNDAFIAEDQLGYLASEYAVEEGDGHAVFLGCFFKEVPLKTGFAPMSKKESLRRNAAGYAYAVFPYRVGTEFTYYIGANERSAHCPEMGEWIKFLTHTGQALRRPLTVVWE